MAHDRRRDCRSRAADPLADVEWNRATTIIDGRDDCGHTAPDRDRVERLHALSRRHPDDRNAGRCRRGVTGRYHRDRMRWPRRNDSARRHLKILRDCPQLQECILPKATTASSTNPSPAGIESVAKSLILHELPGYLIRRLDSRAAFLYEKFTAQSDLTPRQFGVLLTLFQAGPLPQTELGNRLHLDRSTLGEMLQRMVDRKLVERRAHGIDRPAVENALTKTRETA